MAAVAGSEIHHENTKNTERWFVLVQDGGVIGCYAAEGGPGGGLNGEREGKAAEETEHFGSFGIGYDVGASLA